MHASGGEVLDYEEIGLDLEDETVIDIGIVEAATSLREIMREVVARQHRRLDDELGQLTRLVVRVVEIHGDEFPDLALLSRQLGELRNRFVSHCLREEQTLFAWISRLEEAEMTGAVVPRPFFGSMRKAVYENSLDHLAFVTALGTLQKTAALFEHSTDACLGYLLRRIEILHREMFDNLHVENEVLFPRAIELERNCEEQIRTLVGIL